MRDNGGGSTRAGRTHHPVHHTGEQANRAQPIVLRGQPCDASVLSVVDDERPGPERVAALDTFASSRPCRTDGTFSDAFQYTKDEAANEPTRMPFPGPVIVITSALSYSSAEFFAAGFQDHGGMILGRGRDHGRRRRRGQRARRAYGYFAAPTSPASSSRSSRGGFSCAFRRIGARRSGKRQRNRGPGRASRSALRDDASGSAQPQPGPEARGCPIARTDVTRACGRERAAGDRRGAGWLPLSLRAGSGLDDLGLAALISDPARIGLYR